MEDDQGIDLNHNGRRYINKYILSKEFGGSGDNHIKQAKQYDINRIKHGKSILVDFEQYYSWFYSKRSSLNVNHRYDTEIQNRIKSFPEILTIQSQNAIVFSCPHVPFIDVEFYENIKRFASLKRVKAHTLIIAGDFFDMNAFGYWFSETERVDWDDERLIGEKILQDMVDNFKQVVIIPGNHDKRLAKLIAGAGKRISVLEPFRLFLDHPRVTMTIHQTITLDSGGELWQIEHPKSIIREGSITGSRRQAVLGTSIVEGHGHIGSIGPSYDSKHWVITLGMVGDPAKIFYKVSTPTSHAAWTQDFLWIRDDVPRLICKQALPTWIKDYS